MELVQKLSLLTARQLFADIAAARGEGARVQLADLLDRHADGALLAAALARAQARSWKAVEIVLAGESFWDGCMVFLSPEDSRALRARVESLREQTLLPGSTEAAVERRRQCLHELRKAHQAGLQVEGTFNLRALAQSLRATGDEAEAPGKRLAGELRRADYPALADLLEPRRAGDVPLVVAALQHFLRRELDNAPDLRQALGLDTARPLPESQEAALGMIGDVMAVHGRGLQEWLSDEEADTPPPKPPAPAPAASTDEAAPAEEGRGSTKRPGLWAWAGTLAVLVIPILLMLWVVRGYTVTEEQRFVGDGGPVRSVAFLPPDGRQIVSAGDDGTLRLWDAQTGQEVRKFKGHVSKVTGLAVSADGRRLLSSDKDTARLWDVESGKEVNGLALPADANPEDSLIALGFAEGRSLALFRTKSGKLFQIWDVKDKKGLGTFPGEEAVLHCLTLSPDARHALCGENDFASLWDLKKGKRTLRLEGHTGPVTAVAFSADGSRAVTGGVDETVRVWDLGTGKQLEAFSKTASPVVAVALDRAGKRVLSGASGRKGSPFNPKNRIEDRRPLRLWDMATGRERTSLFTGPEGAVWSVAFAPDGSRALSGGEDGVVRLWVVP